MEVTYDGAGREASRIASTPAGALSLSFGGFDAAGRPCTIDAGSAGSKTRAFDQAGRLCSESGYGYTSGLAVPGAELSYNGNTGRLEAEAYRFAFGGRTDSVRSYAYTADGRLASASISGMPDAAYAYEPGTGNLIGIKRGSEPTTTLAYEQGSGRIAALLSQGATQTVFSFDVRNRRASQGTPASPQTVRFFYDDADRLVGYSDASRGVSASYAYDAYGQRLRSVVASGSLVATTAYAYDGLSLLYATTARSDGTTESVAYLYDASGAPFAGIYQGSAAATPVAFFIATTARGDVAELLDSSGAPFALYSYDAYGSPGAVLTASTARISAPLAEAIARANVLRYAGYAYDEHSGLYYLSKRYYDPATAQFLTKDPAKADGEESPYQYCAGDPVGKVDPSGEAARRIRHARTSLRITAHNLALHIIFPVSAGIVASAEVDWSLYDNGLLVVIMAVTYDVSDYIPKGAEIDCDLRAGLAVRGEVERSNGSLRRRRTFDRWAFNSGAKGRFTYALAARANGWISAVGLEAEAAGRWVGDGVTNLRTDAKRTKWSRNPFGRHRPGWHPPDCRRCHSVVPYSQAPVTTPSPRRQVLQ